MTQDEIARGISNIKGTITFDYKVLLYLNKSYLSKFFDFNNFPRSDQGTSNETFELFESLLLSFF